MFQKGVKTLQNVWDPKFEEKWNMKNENKNLYVIFVFCDLFIFYFIM